jgi:methionyl-tRNA formyltransferase
MGTPAFAVAPLRAIYEAGYEIAAVVTVPDKPAGRGLKLQSSPVKDFAIANHIDVLQPVNLKDDVFNSQLAGYGANLYVVVAFRMLPQVVWQMPELGTVNLHASLLPQYRGAAPINHAILNGETETGLTTFFIEQQIDTGNIIKSTKLRIANNETAGILHDRMMIAGSQLMLETLQLIENNEIKPINQLQFLDNINPLKPAPKLTKELCKVNWTATGKDIYNLIRGLSPYPAAFCNLVDTNHTKRQIKLFEAELVPVRSEKAAGSIITDGKKYLEVATADGIIRILSLQPEGKRRMLIDEFLRGTNVNETMHFE